MCLFQFSPLHSLHRDPCCHPLCSGILATFQSTRQIRIPKLTYLSQTAPWTHFSAKACRMG